MLGKLALIGAGAATMLAVGTMPAYATYQDLDSTCAPGDSGKACIHLSWDVSSGHIHARGAVDPLCGHKITIEEVRLDEEVVEPGGQHDGWNPVPGMRNLTDVTSTCGVEDSVAGPMAPLCDNGLQYKRHYRGVMQYRVFYADGSSRGFAITTGGSDSPC